MTKHSFDNSFRAHRVPLARLRLRHRRDVARWALANGLPLRRDALAVITGTRAITIDGTIDTTWTLESVTALLNWEGASWCGRHGVALPSLLGESLQTYLRYLHDNRLLGSGSASLTELTDWAGELDYDDDQQEPESTAGRPRLRRHPTVQSATGNLIHLMPKKSSIPARPS